MSATIPAPAPEFILDRESLEDLTRQIRRHFDEILLAARAGLVDDMPDVVLEPEDAHRIVTREITEALQAVNLLEDHIRTVFQQRGRVDSLASVIAGIGAQGGAS